MAVDSKNDDRFGMGAAGFARRWGDQLGSSTVHQFTGGWAAASLLKQDPRYHRLSRSGIGPRLLHAVSRVVVTSNDDGDAEFNASGLIGIASGAAASTAWHRGDARSAKLFLLRFGTSVGWDAVGKLLREFLAR